MSRFLFTWYGISVTTIESLSPFFDSSIVAFARSGDRAAAGRVGLNDPVPADDEAAGRESRGRESPSATAVSRASFGWPRMLDDGNDAVDHLAHVVRRHVRRHADGDPRRSVHSRFGNVVGRTVGSSVVSS